MNVKAKDVEILHSVKAIIDNDFWKPITIGYLAKQAGVHPGKLQNGFKQVFHKPVYTYLLNVRMNKARELLTNTDNYIKEIAAATGYKSTSSFTVAFKKWMNMTPSEYRSRNRG